MSKQTLIAASLAVLVLSGCGSSEQPPIEQIVIREPGEPAATLPGAGAGTDLVASGKAAFAMCSACHTAASDAASVSGPNLYGVVGRKAALLEDYGYSQAMAASGITWSEAELDEFLRDPQGAVPGTAMAAGAVTDPDRRAAIIAYLAGLSE